MDGGTRREDVVFHFTDSDLTGSVETAGGDMVLDIPGGDGPYRIIGRPVGHYFEGGNAVRGGNRVHAKWAEVGGEYVGIWREEGDE